MIAESLPANIFSPLIGCLLCLKTGLCSESMALNPDITSGICFTCYGSLLEIPGVQTMYDHPIFIVLLVAGVVMLALSKFRSRRLTKKERPPKYVSRRDNPLKAGLRRFSKESTDSWCRRAQAQNLAFPSDARDALCSALRGLGFRIQLEVRVTPYGRNYFLDVFLPDQKIWFECDGEWHKSRRRKDLGRDEAIKQVYGYKCIRKWNSFYTKPGLKQRLLVEIQKAAAKGSYANY